MARTKTDDWRNLSYEKWTVTTVRTYIKERHEEVYGIPYVTNNHAMEGRLIKSMLADHGGEVVKGFIEACIASYTPTKRYPGLNFAFMFSYMRTRELPAVLLEIKRRKLEEATQQPAETGDENENNSDWW